MCVVVCITCLMCSCVVCAIVCVVFAFMFLCAPCLNVCKCNGCDLWLFVMYCVMVYYVSVMCDCACVSP